MFPTISPRGGSFTDTNAPVGSPKAAEKPRSGSPLRGSREVKAPSRRPQGGDTFFSTKGLDDLLGSFDTQLRDALDERSQQNTRVLQVLREATIGPPPSPSKSTEGLPGALFQAAGMSSPQRVSSVLSEPFFGPRPGSATRGSGGGAAVAADGHRWAVSENEGLGWVRSLVRFTEANPISLATTLGPVGDDVPQGDNKNSSSLPAIRTSRREDVAALQRWLEDAMRQLSQPGSAHAASQPPSALQQQLLQQGLLPSTAATSMAPRPTSAKGRGGRGAGSVEAGGGVAPLPQELTEGAIHVYGVAFEELKRQVTTECKERGELMTTLFDHVLSLVELRTSFAAESKLEAMQMQYLELMDSKDKLQLDLQGLKDSVISQKHEETKAVVHVKEKEKRAVQKLVQIQKATEVLSRDYKVADLALKNEVERRLELEEVLSTTQTLLTRTEAEWLTHRQGNKDLQKKVEGLTHELAEARKEIEQAAVARGEGHTLYEVIQMERANLEVELARVRHEYKTDAIIVVGLRQQVKELDEQLGSIKTFNRDQAIRLAVADEENERQTKEIDAKEKELEALRGESLRLESFLETTTTKLEVASIQLVQKEADLQVIDARQTDDIEVAQKVNDTLQVDVKQLNDQVADALYRLNAKELAWRELYAEVECVREVLASSVTNTLNEQGADGILRPGDKGWGSTGPMGGVQRTMGVVVKQLRIMGERLESFRQENDILTTRLGAEVEMLRRIQMELHESRSAEAKMLKGKDDAYTRLEVSQSLAASLGGDSEKIKAQVVDLQETVKSQGEFIKELSEQVNYMRPFEPKCRLLADDLEVSKRGQMVAEDKLLLLQEENLQLHQNQAWHKEELEKLVEGKQELMNEITALKILAHEGDDLKEELAASKEELTLTRDRFHATVDSLSSTIDQLELTKFLLNGLGNADLESPEKGNIVERMVESYYIARAPSPEILTLGGSEAPTSANWGVPAGGANLLPGSTQRLPSMTQRLPSMTQPLPGSAQRPPTSGSIKGPGTPAASADPYRPASGYELGESSPRPRSRPGFSPSTVYVPGSSIAGPPTEFIPSRPTTAKSASSARPGMDLEVAAVLEHKRQHSKQLQTQVNWLKVKVRVMSYFSSKLREKLVAETEKRVQLEIDIARLEVHLLEQARRREEFLAVDLLASLQAATTRARIETAQSLSALRAMLPPMHADLATLARNSTVVCMKLHNFQEAVRKRVDADTQTDVELDSVWAVFMQNLPKHPPNQPITELALIDAITRIYLRQASSIVDYPVWGADRNDTVYDAIMAHYNSQRAPGAFNSEFLNDPEGPIARLLRGCRKYKETTKIAMFTYFVGFTPDGVKWPTASWHFFLHLLHCLRILLSGTWKSTCIQWASTKGAQIPMQAAYDLAGNLFNVQTPTDLEGAVSQRLNAIVVPGQVVPGQSGSVVDLDALLLLLVNEYNLGNCPRAALLYPRRVTDGKLFNLFNHAGHTPNLDAIAGAKKDNLISHKPPPVYGAAKARSKNEVQQVAMAEKLAEGVKYIWQPSMAKPQALGGGGGSTSHSSSFGQRPATVPAPPQGVDDSVQAIISYPSRLSSTSHGRGSQKDY